MLIIHRARARRWLPVLFAAFLLASCDTPKAGPAAIATVGTAADDALPSVGAYCSRRANAMYARDADADRAYVQCMWSECYDIRLPDGRIGK